jgi:hypothetical protein
MPEMPEAEMSELDQLFDKPMEIDLGEVAKPKKPAKEKVLKIAKEAKRVDTNDFKRFLSLLMAFFMGFIGYPLLILLAPGLMGMRDYKNMKLDGEYYLGEMQRYCFNPVPMFNDYHSCKVWGNQYVAFISRTAPPLYTFTAEQKQEFQQDLEEKGIIVPIKHPGEAEAEAAMIPGNAQSPAL